MILPPRCSERRCIHYQGIKQPDGTEASEVPVCAAFPNGIPEEIAYGDNLHLDEVDGDNGIVFERDQTVTIEE
jgi:hypothetical protein